MHDVIFHIIFGSDLETVLEFVHASAVRLYSITQCSFLVPMMDSIMAQRAARQQQQQHHHAGRCEAHGFMMAPAASHGPDVLKALFFLFLNVDMVLKDYVCEPNNKRAFAAAMNIKWSSVVKSRQQRSDEDLLERLHAWSMIGTLPMNAAKARRFFTVLHDDIVRTWLQDERLHASDLVRMVKEQYLIC